MWTSARTHARLYASTCTHTHYHTPPPAPVTQYDFLQIPKSDPGWNISARLPRQFASTILPLSLFLSFSLLFSAKDDRQKNIVFPVGVRATWTGVHLQPWFLVLSFSGLFISARND